MFCYRRHGHNEGDEPAFTQPVMYKKIADHPARSEIYSKRLIAEGVMTEGEVEKAKADWRARLDAELEAGSGYKPNKADWLDGKWAGFKSADQEEDPRRGVTGVDVAVLKDIGRKITKVPDGFPRSPHHPALPRKPRQGDRHGCRHRLGDRRGAGVLHAAEEAITSGCPVRTPSAAPFAAAFGADRSGGREPLHARSSISRPDQGHYEVINSLLSEEAVLGFEYGYSLAEPQR
jgi:2-oxoglutarate dehydrogenase E1 component